MTLTKAEFKTDVLEQGNETVQFLYLRHMASCHATFSERRHTNAIAMTESSLAFFILVQCCSAFRSVQSPPQLAWMLILFRVFSVQRSIMSSWLGLGGIAGVFFSWLLAASFAVSYICTHRTNAVETLEM